MLRPDGGQIFLGGEEITGLRPEARVRQGLARTFQINTLFPRLTALESVTLSILERNGFAGAWRKRLPAYRDAIEEAFSILASLRLQEVSLKQTKELAYGQQRLLEIALALATRPRVLLLDEPAAGLSPEETRRMVTLVRSLKGRYTIVLIEHKIDIIMSVSDRISVMHFGSLIAEGTPQEIQRDPEVRRAYLGGVAA